jgi:predicted transcriptional regulator
MQKVLINFNLSKPIKERFDYICRENGRTRTSVLVDMITEYLIREGTRLADQQALINDVDAALEKSKGLMGYRNPIDTNYHSTCSVRQTWGDNDLDLPSPMLSDGREEW